MIYLTDLIKNEMYHDHIHLTIGRPSHIMVKIINEKLNN